MMENIFTQKYGQALICEDVSQNHKAIGMALVRLKLSRQ